MALKIVQQRHKLSYVELHCSKLIIKCNRLIDLTFPKLLTSHQLDKVRPSSPLCSLCLFACLLLHLDIEPPKQHVLQTNS